MSTGPSRVTARLAKDLVELGNLMGFEASKETAITNGSNFKIDVNWKLHIPIFGRTIVASIEIQNSDSISSISHNIFKTNKTVHPALHVVISYQKLSDECKNNVLKKNFPSAGL